MDVDCSSLSRKEINSSFSAKKQKKKVLKNVLLSSKQQLFKCLRTSSDNFETVLETLLPRARITDLTNDNKEARSAARNSLCLGVNAVNRELQKENICGVLLTADVNPESLVSHLIQRCSFYDVPILKVNKFRTITYNALGFECIALGFKKSFGIFKDLVKLTYDENNKTMIEEVPLINNVEDNIMQVEANIDKPDTIVRQEDDSSVVFLEEKPQERVFAYFKRSDNSKRMFSPEKYNEEHGLLNKLLKVSDKDFISIQDQTICLDESAEPGISSTIINSNARKRNKEYVPATVLKLESNVNRKKKK